jgi:hypothetical protein
MMVSNKTRLTSFLELGAGIIMFECLEKRFFVPRIEILSFYKIF